MVVYHLRNSKWYGQANEDSKSGKVVQAASNFMTLTEYREISGLEFQNAEDVFMLFAANSTDGVITLSDFKEYVDIFHY